MTLKVGFHQPVRLRETQAVLRRLPEAVSPLRILHFSDIHLAGRKRQEGRLLELLSSVPADMIVFTGDALYRYESDGAIALRFFERLAELVHPHLGFHLVRGNHDNAGAVSLLRNAGFSLLINSYTVIGEGASSWYLVGVDDSRWTADSQRWECHVLPTVLKDVPAESFKIVMAHSPDILPAAAAAEVDLVLTGHTHGGQIRFPGVGALMTRTIVSSRYAWGLQTYENTLCHTTCGAGSSFPPIRLSCPQEVVLLELVRG